ncbi:hypothetical protein OEA41_009873 [Lepraria neglecta]|uniref:Uncharacterized protein n=1 Tax=Lepraria neglecta TaxID=209136 RepID=A0AAD9YZR3_9LECA|nr:hypothetical protein OEA41_009873 [Lepraria neglecta]
MANKDEQEMTSNEPEELKAEGLSIHTNAMMLKGMKDVAESDPEQQEAYRAEQEAKKRAGASSRSENADIAKETFTKEWLKALSLDDEADEKATPSAKTKAETKGHATK